MTRLAVIGLILAFFTTPAWAEGEFIDIFPKSVQDIELVLSAVEERLNSADTETPPPIIMMLHGPEATRFLRSNYQQNRALVDQTAKLASFGLLDVKICETWLRGNDHDHSELFPFVGTVPFGEGEIDRLEAEEGYVEFAFKL